MTTRHPRWTFRSRGRSSSAKACATSDRSSLATAAKKAKIELVTTTPFAIDDDPPPQVDVSIEGAEQFRQGVRDLRSELAGDSGQEGKDRACNDNAICHR